MCVGWVVGTGDEVNHAPVILTCCCVSAEASRQDLVKTVTEMASRGLRTLCLAYADVSADKVGSLDKLEGPPELPLTACCMLGIKVSPERMTFRLFLHDSLSLEEHLAVTKGNGVCQIQQLTLGQNRSCVVKPQKQQLTGKACGSKVSATSSPAKAG